MITLSLDIGHDDPTGICIMDGDKVLYLGTDTEKIKDFNYEKVIVSEQVTEQQLAEILHEDR